MANVTREYETNKIIKMMIDCDDATDYVNLVNSGEDKGNYKYNLIETPALSNPYIELEVTEMQYCYSTSSIRRKYEMTNDSIKPRYVFSGVNTEDLQDGKACFFTNTTSNTISSLTNASSGTYVQPVISSNIDDTTGKKVWGLVYFDSNNNPVTVLGGTAANVSISYVSIQGGGNPGTMSQSIISILGGWQHAMAKCKGTINSTLPIASSLSGALKYIRTGDESELLNGGGAESVGKDREYTLYYYADVYKTQFSHRKPSTFVRRDKLEFVVTMYDAKKDMPIAKFNRGVIGWVDDENGSNGMNLRFMKNTTVNNLIEVRVNGVKVDNFNFSAVHSTYKNNYKDGNFYYYAKINTNMYIFDSLANAQGLIDDLNDKLNGLLHGGQNGDTVETNLNTNSVDYGCGMSETFILTKAQMLELAQRFNTVVSSDGNILSGMFIGLGMHNNPIDVCIDLFALPIVVDDFVVTTKSHINLGVTHTSSNDTTV